MEDAGLISRKVDGFSSIFSTKSFSSILIATLSLHIHKSLLLVENRTDFLYYYLTGFFWRVVLGVGGEVRSSGVVNKRAKRKVRGLEEEEEGEQMSTEKLDISKGLRPKATEGCRQRRLEGRRERGRGTAETKFDWR